MTHKSDVLSCLEILAENEARDAGTPETAYQLFERKRERYRVDPVYRAEADAYTRAARRMADDAKAHARQDVLRSVAETTATAPDRVEGLHEDLLHDYVTDSLIRARVDRLATGVALCTLKNLGEGLVGPMPDGTTKH